jgi:hypothetical protein
MVYDLKKANETAAAKIIVFFLNEKGQRAEEYHAAYISSSSIWPLTRANGFLWISLAVLQRYALAKFSEMESASFVPKIFRKLLSFPKPVARDAY